MRGTQSSELSFVGVEDKSARQKVWLKLREKDQTHLIQEQINVFSSFPMKILVYFGHVVFPFPFLKIIVIAITKLVIVIVILITIIIIFYIFYHACFIYINIRDLCIL